MFRERNIRPGASTAIAALLALAPAALQAEVPEVPLADPPPAAVTQLPARVGSVDTPPVPLAEVTVRARPDAAATGSPSASYWALAAGGLASMGLAVWGFVAIGRRKSPLDRRIAALERSHDAEPAPDPQAAMPAPPPSAASVHDLRRPAPPPPASLAHTGASVALPRALPERFEDRDALLRRMIAAAPDRANPFTSYRARCKRARLILQSLGRDFADAEPRIDLGQYSANWPEPGRDEDAAA